MKITLAMGLALGWAQIASAAVVDNFEREKPEIASSPAAKISLVEAPGGAIEATGRALAVDWSFPHAPWIEFAYAHPQVILDKQPVGAVALKLETWQPGQPGMIELGLRLLDARGEIFQWGSRLPRSAEAGWHAVTIPISEETANAHWAGNNNGRIEYPVRLFGYSMVFANSSVPAGRALIDAVRLEAIPQITLETDRFPSLVNATGPGKCDLVISNPEDKELEVKLAGKITAFSGTGLDLAGTLLVPARGSARFAVPLGDRRPGYRFLNCQVKFQDTEIPFKTPLVISDPLQRTNGKADFLFGICAHTEREPEEEWEAEFQAAAAAGASVMRVGPAWAAIEPKAGEFQFDAMDKLVALGAKYGIEIQAILGMGPSHAIAESLRAAQAEAYKQGNKEAWKYSLFGPPEEGPWRRYVAAMAARYKGKIRLYEVWNEPDLGFWRGTTEQYIGILRAARAEIGRVDPGALVLSGGFATVSEHAGRAQNPNLQEQVLRTASDSFDIHALHQHGPFREFQGAVEGELQRIRAAMPVKKPLYFNETALSAFGDERGQAHALVKKMAYVLGMGAVGYTWYDLRNDGSNPANPEHNYGLLNHRLKPKPAYAAYTELVRRLQGHTPAGKLNLGASREALLFSAPRGRTLVWWNEADGAGSVAALFRVPAGKVSAVDIMGHAVDVPVVEEYVLGQPAREPQYLEFPAGSGKPELVGQLITIAGPQEAAAGQPLNLKAEAYNPLAREIKMELSWKTPGGTKTSTLLVPARGRATLDLPPTPVGPRSVVATLDVDFAVQGTPWAGAVRYSAPVTRTIAAVGPDNRPADWTIANRWEVVSLTGADPALAHLVWKNAEDLSAAVWMWRSADALRVRVDVKDDVHFQNETAQEIWKGDSVQLAFQGVEAREGWEIGAARGPNGQVLRGAWAHPASATHAAQSFRASCQPLPAGLCYEFELPLAQMGLDEAQLQRGLRFNLLVNDNDGNLREGFARLAGGFGQVKDLSLYPVVKAAGP